MPMGHVTAGTSLDEDVWKEVQEFRKALVKMFLGRGEDCVFMETAMGFRRQPHMVIECVPVPEDMGSMLPMYYQKAIQVHVHILLLFVNSPFTVSQIEAVELVACWC